MLTTYESRIQPKVRYVPLINRLGTRLRYMRQMRNLSQSEIASSFGIDRSYLSDVELGKKSMSLPMLQTFATGFNMSVSELVKDL